MKITDLLFPPKCAACRALQPIPESENNRIPLCEECLQKWKTEKETLCLICGQEVQNCLCSTEEMRNQSCRVLVKLAYYFSGHPEKVQWQILYHIKHRRERNAPAFLSKELLPTVEKLLLERKIKKEDVLISFLPRRKVAVLRYGLDQAEELASELSKLSGIPMERTLKRAGWNDLEQKRLPFRARLRNMKKAFRYCGTEDIKGKTVLLVDDMVTTGAGMSAGTKILRKNGAKQVFGVAVTLDESKREI